jgi:hypothetical protein
MAEKRIAMCCNSPTADSEQATAKWQQQKLKGKKLFIFRIKNSSNNSSEIS